MQADVTLSLFIGNFPMLKCSLCTTAKMVFFFFFKLTKIDQTKPIQNVSLYPVSQGNNSILKSKIQKNVIYPKY